jgi:hypothetical protein
MAEIENKVKLEGWSCKLTKETKETLTELQNSGDFGTVNQMMETLIERYYSPIKSQDQSAKITELEAKIKELQELNSQTSGNNDKVVSDLSGQIMSLRTALIESRSNFDLVIAERNQLEQELIRALANGELPGNGRIIAIDPINWKILEFVADREGAKRNQPWTVDDVINYFIHFRFEKGSLNGDLKSVPDSEITKMKAELKQE